MRKFLAILFFINLFTLSYVKSEEVPVIVISPGKSSQSYSTVGSAITVIDKEEIENSNEFFLSNVLDGSQPGMNLFQQGGYGAISGLQLRGLAKRYSTVFIDGVRMSDPSSPDNSYYMSNILNNSIERVEILRGSQSSLYGSSAIAGTINIYTTKGKDKKNKKFEVSQGSNDSRNITFTYGDTYDNHEYYLGLNKFVTDGISAMNDNDEKDEYKNDGVVGNYGYKISDEFRFEGGLRYSDSFYAYDTVKVGTTDDNDFTDDYELSYNFKLIHEIGKSKNSLIYNKYDTERSVNTNTNTTKNYYGERDAINFLGEYNFNLDTKIVYGFDNEFDKAKFKKDWPTDYLESDESVHSQYFDVQFRPKSIFPAVSEKLYSTLGVRRDDHTTAGQANTHRATLAYKIDNDSKIRASYGTGIRMPALYDYFYGTVVSEKETLDPEKSTSWDVGYETLLENINTSFNVSLFKVRYDNALKGWESQNWTVKNSVANYDSKGIELATLWKPTEKYNFGLNYNYTKSYDGGDCDDPDNVWLCIDTQTVRVPRHEIMTSLNYLPTKNFLNNLSIRYTGERRDYGNGSGLKEKASGFEDVILDDYITFNYAGQYNILGYKFFLKGNNLFDQNYEEAYKYSTPGRTFDIGLKRAF